MTIKMLRKKTNKQKKTFSKYSISNDHPSQNKINIYFTQMKYYFYYRRKQWKQNSQGTFYTNIALIVIAFKFEIQYIYCSRYSQSNGTFIDFIRYYFIIHY